MAEYINPSHFPSGYMPEMEPTRLDLYRLLNQFLASKNISDLCEEDAWLCEAMGNLDYFFENEAIRILLSAAVLARVIDDREHNLKNFDTDCGELIPDVKNPNNVIPLTLREACNKIIHATTIRYDVEVVHLEQRYLNPFVYYYGKKGKVEWKATLNVIDFVSRYTLNVVY